MKKAILFRLLYAIQFILYAMGLVIKQVPNKINIRVKLETAMDLRFGYTERDREFWELYLEDFVPAKLYDMHVHLRKEKGQEHLPGSTNILRTEIDLDTLQEYSSYCYPGRECHFLLLGTPVAGMDVRNHNAWLAGEVRKDPDSVGGMIVAPETRPEELDAAFSSGHFHAVKPYRIFASDPARARITEFLPERLLEVIDHYRKAVTLHLSMPEGPASEPNLKDLRDLTSRYPGVKWILAHCARAFNANFLVRSIHVLKHLPNLFYDTSAVNDLYTHCLLLKYEDRTRIMFGSDNFAAGGAHGKYITYADAWQFFPGSPPLEHCRPDAVPVVYEQLLQQKRAADMLELSQDEINRIFCGNAQRFIRELKS